jgi:RNA polymerase sigma factor (sigma-70 family)
MARAGASDLIAIFQSLYEDLLRMVAVRTGDAERAADIVHDAYFRLVAAQEAGQPIDDPRAYIIRVAQNLAIDDGRRRTRSLQRHAPEDAAAEMLDGQPLADAVALGRERLRLLDAALQELPANVRQALLLNRVEGMTQAEIARRLGVSESMVVKYVAQALKHCRKWRKRIDS